MRGRRFTGREWVSRREEEKGRRERELIHRRGSGFYRVMVADGEIRDSDVREYVLWTVLMIRDKQEEGGEAFEIRSFCSGDRKDINLDIVSAIGCRMDGVCGASGWRDCYEGRKLKDEWKGVEIVIEVFVGFGGRVLRFYSLRHGLKIMEKVRRGVQRNRRLVHRILMRPRGSIGLGLSGEGKVIAAADRSKEAGAEI